ncbi:MAG: DUF2304 family protein [Polyangiales bacterium]
MRELLLYLAYLMFAVYALTRFGRVISAARALPMWIVLVALGVAVAAPDVLLPIASVFGIRLVSNMVFATMILFLLFESLAGAAEQTKSQRQVRKLVSRLAMRDYAAPTVGEAPRALVVVPAYNEAANIEAVLRQLAEVRVTSGGAIDVLLVDDGSLDDTARIARKVAGEGAQVITHVTNIGVGGVLMTGFLVAIEHGYTQVVQCDADGQHPVAQIPALLAAARARGTDVLVGSRFCASTTDDLSTADDESTTGMRRFGGRLISWALRAFGAGAKVADPTSGFRVYSMRAARLLAARMPDEYPEPESIALSAIHGLSIAEMPVAMNARQHGESSISGWKSAIFMVKVLTSLLSFRLRQALGRAG